MLSTSSNTNLDVLSALSSLCREWQEAAKGDSLLDMEANVGLMLADFINTLNLSVQEQTQILGPDLFKEMQELLAFSPKQ
jgi:hypothetical protein